LNSSISRVLRAARKYYNQPDITLAIDGHTWTKLYLNATIFKDAVNSRAVKVERGDADEAARIFDLFDKFEPARNVTIPPLHD
jgi:alkyl sulfatase BDS1-like metallo-beta-lactamase superfamily hydrolase